MEKSKFGPDGIGLLKPKTEMCRTCPHLPELLSVETRKKIDTMLSGMKIPHPCHEKHGYSCAGHATELKLLETK